jgi:hypothetical protein
LTEEITENEKRIIIFALGNLTGSLLKNPHPWIKPEECFNLAKKLGAKID